MYIAPNSTIILLHNCPLDKTYDHTLTFTSALAQQNYFKSLAKYTFNDQSYTRYQRGVLTIQKKAEDLYDCNYLMFQNTSFGDKWFYAFVTAIDYVNNVTSRVSFEIDVMQTWKFEYTLGQCFVEREHSLTDDIGDNLVPENLELGEYVSDGTTRCSNGEESSNTSLLKDLCLVFACTFNDDMSDYKGGYYAGMYSGLRYKVFDFPTDQSEITTFINSVHTWLTNMFQKINGIECAYVMPKAFVPVNDQSVPIWNVSFYKNRAYTDIDGYVPKNKKLFTYPYNFLYCTNFQGQSCAYPYEYFDDTNPTRCFFNLQSDFSPSPTVILTPLHYKGTGLEENYDEKMTLTGYPMIPFATDVFRAWLANGANDTVVNAMTTIGRNAIIGGLAGSAVPGAGTVAGAGLGILSGVLSTLSTTMHKIIEPPQSHGGVGSTTMASIRLLDFGFMNKHIRSEFARIIDDYFNMFGYATHRVKVPNRTSRPHWNYVKTVGCVAVGSIPADDMAKIMSIYDRGITFWKNGNEVGNYSLDNSPV